MIISPPLLLQEGLTSSDSTETDPMMAAVQNRELMHGIYPIAFDRRWHGGTHLMPSNQKEPVRAIADGEVIAYRIGKTPITDGRKGKDGNPALNSCTGFVLLKHTTETGEGRTLTFYSLYMHLLDIQSQNSLVPQPLPKDQKTDSSPDALAAWLLAASTGNAKDGYTAQPGNGLKVRRKDMLGYVGACHGQPHLHFEIFMTQEDFNTYFGTTQLGQRALTPPASTDVWGHSYYVIPGGQVFRSGPPTKFDSDYFPTLQNGQLDNASTLYVEAYFDKGQRYTRSWLDKGDGQLTPLTRDPVKDAYPDYEYKLYDRAKALYPGCPSDGYELLRFGRILSSPATLTDGQFTSSPGFASDLNGDPRQFQIDSPRATWVAVTFDASGSQGYVDINQDTIQKLSDADFPFITGWQKITDGNTPFDEDGLCGYDELRKLVGDVEAMETPEQRNEPEYEQEDLLSAYVKQNGQVRQKLRGFICEAPSEWDSSNNDKRYAGLNEPGGFDAVRKATQPNGYRDFITFLQKLQFWNATGLPTGEKLWFFHPVQFIRHFRKCDWLSLREQTQLLPRKSMPMAGGLIRWSQSNERFTIGALTQHGNAPAHLAPALNHIFRKYGLTGSQRKAHFLGQAFKETMALTRTSELGGDDYLREMYEVYTPQEAARDYDDVTKRAWLQKVGFLRGRERATYIRERPEEVHQKAKAGGNTQPGDGPRFCGRGLIHLTWRNNYRDYGRYRGRDFTTDPNPQLLQSDAEVAGDSAGYFWVMNNIDQFADKGTSDQDVKACFRKVGGVDGLPERQEFFHYTYFILGDTPSMPSDRYLIRQTEDEV